MWNNAIETKYPETPTSSVSACCVVVASCNRNTETLQLNGDLEVYD